MTWEVITSNLPALLVAVPLFAAFLCPLIGRFSPGMRASWVFGALVLTAAIAYILAFIVYSQGTVVYVFGATTPDLSVPIDSGGIPIRIMLTVDAGSVGYNAWLSDRIALNTLP